MATQPALVAPFRGERYRATERLPRLIAPPYDVIAADQPYTFLVASTATYVLDRKMVIVERDAAGREHYRPIEPVKGILTFHFERWRKLASDPVLEAGG